jgi:hypothetical protein
MDDNKLTSLGLRPSDNFVKTQLALAMAHGITLTLCNDDYIGLAVHGILAIIVKIKQQRLNLTLQDKQNPITIS